MKKLIWEAITPDDLPRIAAGMLAEASRLKIWCFHGDLGAGKTTLIKELCRQLGVQGEVTSPTFGIVHEYTCLQGEHVYHMDFYRLKNPEEAFDIGCENYLFSDYFCFIEWPEKAGDLLNMEKADIFIEVIDSGRKIILNYE